MYMYTLCWTIAFSSFAGNILGNVIDTVISGLGDILQIPRGCGEQTMITLAPNVYVYRYLKHTNQFTAELEVSAQQYIGGGEFKTKKL